MLEAKHRHKDSLFIEFRGTSSWKEVEFSNGLFFKTFVLCKRPFAWCSEIFSRPRNVCSSTAYGTIHRNVTKSTPKYQSTFRRNLVLRSFFRETGVILGISPNLVWNTSTQFCTMCPCDLRTVPTNTEVLLCYL